jgi:hypothetical protein
MRIDITEHVYTYERMVGGVPTLIAGTKFKLTLRDGTNKPIYEEEAFTRESAIERGGDWREALDQPGAALIISNVNGEKAAI